MAPRHSVAAGITWSFTKFLRLLIAVLLIAAGLVQFAYQGAEATPTSEFEIDDANIVDAAGAPQDWGSVFGRVGGVGPVIAKDAAAFAAATFTEDSMSSDDLPSPPCDPGKKGDLTVFTSGGSDKNGDALNTWTFESGSVPNSKDDLTNVYAAALTGPNKNIFYFALDRANTNGSAHLDFEFLKSAVGTQVTGKDSSGCPSGTFTGVRTAGDILLSMDFTNGGAIGTTEIRLWDGDSYEVVNPGPAMDLFQNGSPIACGDWRCRDETGAVITQLPANAFVEGFIDAQALGLTGCYSTYNAKSRSSHEWNSELKDIALGNFNTCEARISLTPNGVNEVGDPHVLTAHVDVRPGTDFEAAPAGTKVNLGIKSGPGSLSAPFCLTVGTTGSCQVTLDSASAGTTVVAADTTVQVGPLTLTRSTDTNPGPGGSGNAVKEWADAYIKVTPDGVNPVNQQHVFDVEFGVLPGGAPTVSGVAIVADAVPNPATESSTCGTPTAAGNNVWTCTVTINSPEAKVFDVDATGTATVSKPGVGSVTLTRSTDANLAPHGPGGNDGATKTYVDARIKIGPDGLNEVNDEHTVTATVETKDGNGPWTLAPNGTTVDFVRTGAGGFVSGTDSCTTSGGTGSCSVEIVSAVVGTTNVSATTTLDVHGVSLTRSTDGTAGNSGPLTKRWADASIKVEETAVNEVNDDHEFTVTVTAHKPSNETVTFESIVPSVDPAPNSQSSTCNAPSVNGDEATCKFTINSPTAGVFDVDATAVVKFDDGTNPVLSITRSTDPAVAPAGPGGNQGAAKTYVDARVSVGPDGVNAVGDQHEVIGKAEFADDASGFKPADGETIHFDIVQGVGSFVNGVDSCTADANGECSVFIVSNVPGVTWVAASTSYDVLGVTLSRVSAANPTDDANLRKEWVDAKIEITPDGINPVGQQHKFDVKVTAASSGAPITFGAITTTVTPTPDSAGDDCATPATTPTTATCSLIINSNDADVFTANAAATVTIGGVVFNLKTDGTGNNSGPAVKTYVDARISVGPDGVNAVGDPHPVNAHLEINDGSGWKDAPAGVQIDLVKLSGPGDLSANSCITDSDGECSATLNSATTGTTVVSASATVDVLTVALTRSTNSNAGPGGSDNLVKHWVNASITITPDGINPVGSAHTFTITVTAGGVAAGAVSFGAITTSVSPAPDSQSDTCATPVTTADTATCTLTINNDTAGTFVANATADVTIGGVTVKRSTNPAVAPAGPNGSGPATKHYSDAYIKVTPDGVNPVNEAHVFDVEFGVLPGGGDTVTNVSIDPSVSPAPSSLADTCATPVAASLNVWTCTITINSDEAKVFAADATGTATVSKSGVPGSVTLTRSTDSAVAPHGPGGNDGATKTYVDARIKIGPDGLNEVNDEHTVTATVEIKDGNGAWTLAPAGTDVEFARTGAGGFVSSVDECSTVGSTGECSVKIVSAVVGTTNVSATTTLTVHGVSLTRTTDGQRGNSGPLTKRWADASIKVEETAVNEVNDDHVFTITATAHRPNTETVTFASITPSVVPSPSTKTSTCDNPALSQSNTVATCTFTINSPTAGIFDVDATTVVKFDDGKNPVLSITRSTDPNVAPAGPDGNEGATKTFVDAEVAIGPDGVNAVGDAHTVTGTAKFNDGTGLKPAAGETIEFAITQGVGSFVNGVDSCVTGAQGTCTVQINSSVAGVTWVSASTSYDVLGVTLNRTTAASATDPANLRKEWVDAKIEITPNGVNPVGEPHTFDIKVTASSSGAAINFGAITTSVSPTPGSSSNTCGAPQVNAGVATCTLTVNNPTADVFTATASATVTIGGVVFGPSDLTTNGQGNNSGPATKTYVDANIQVTPDGVNEVGDPHTVTGHVNVDDGTGMENAPEDTVITFAIVSGPGSLSANQCATVAATGSCSVTLNSSQPGVTLVSATTTVDVKGVVLTRSSDGLGQNSDNLQKRWVDGLITIGPSAVNPLNVPHEFTVTVTGIPSGAQPVAFGPITVSVTPAPDVQTHTCANPKVDGNVATCTLTINSGVPGVFTANATATITMGGTAIVRSTDVKVAPAGPGGSGPAIKTYEPPPPEVQGVQILPRTGDFLMRNLWFGALLALAGAWLSRLNRRRQVQ